MFLRSVLAIVGKDLRIELRTREIVLAMALFSALILLLFAFAFIREGRASPDEAAGILWVTIAMAGTLGLGRAFDREREGETFSALLMAPIARNAIYLGKVLGVALFMLVAAIFAVPLIDLLFDVALMHHPITIALLLMLGTIGFASVGALFGAMLLRNRGRHVLLSILLYPIVVPVLIAGARGTQALLVLPADLETFALWTKILALFDVTFIILALWVFEPLVGMQE